MKTTLIFLTYNEIDGITALWDRLPKDAVDEMIAVDGGSTDGTVEFFESKKVPVIRQERKGRGSAFMYGMDAASGDYLLYFSPDGNEDYADIPKLVEKAKEGYDLVIASRFAHGAKSDDSDDPMLVRHLGNNFFTLLANTFWGVGVSDAINGLRIVKKTALRELKLTATQHEIEFQMSIRMAKLGKKITEISTIEHERIGGNRKAKTFVMGVRFMRFFIDELLIGKKF